MKNEQATVLVSTGVETTIPSYTGADSIQLPLLFKHLQMKTERVKMQDQKPPVLPDQKQVLQLLAVQLTYCYATDVMKTRGPDSC